MRNLNLLRFLGLLFLGGLATTAALIAQPSGGPYGPIQQRYEVPAAPHVYYVAPDGSADARGTLTSPTTLAAAIERVVTGDAIILRGGTYRAGSLRLSQGVTIQPYLSERPVIKGTEVATDWAAAGEGKWSTTWTKLFPAEPADWWRRAEFNLRRSPMHMFNNDMVFLNGEFLQAVGTADEVTAGTYHIDYENARVTIGVDPADKLVEITAHNNAIVRTTREAHGKANDGKGPTLRGLTFTQYARLALLVEGTEPGAYMPPSEFGKEIVGTTFEHLTISWCSRTAGYFRGDGLTMRHCLVSDCGTEGIYVINSANVLLEKNIVTHTNSAENLVGYYATAIKIFNQSYNCIVRDNLIIDNPNSSGVWYDVGNVDGIFVNNWIENTPNGFFFEISKGAICAGNVFVDCNLGIRILNSSGVQVYQNTFYNSPAGFQRNSRSFRTGDHFGWHSSAGPDVTERHGHSFVNNLLVFDDTENGPLLHFSQQRVDDILHDPMVDLLDGNVYVRRAGTTAQPLIGWAPVDNDEHRVNLDSPAALQALRPEFEAKSVAYPDYWGPLFRGAELGRFELLKEFPGSGAGVPLPQAIRTALGRDDTATFPGAYRPE